MDELKSCRICGKFFQQNAFYSVCPSCIEQNENEFQKIREYLYQHPQASIYEVATNLDVTITKIKNYLRDGRIEIVEKGNQFLTCATCKKPIHTGWYCDDCLKSSKQDIKISHSGTSNSSVSETQNDLKRSTTKINYLSKGKK